jgi:myo-inositol-1(or 4)-monophosphatase
LVEQKLQLPVSISGKNAWDVAREISLSAGEILLDWWPKSKEISDKGQNDIVTNVDRECEAHIRETLASYFPEHGIFGEEEKGDDPTTGWTWIIDPIDGTQNYAWGIPCFSIVIALAKDGEVVAGVNFDPINREMFHAARGKGAFLNDKKIQVSEILNFEDVIMVTDPAYGPVEGTTDTLQMLRKIWPSLKTARMIGSSALSISYVAAGRMDIFVHHRLQPYDQAAGIILMEEAGGLITDRQGNRAQLYSDGLIASSSTIHQQFMERTKHLQWRKPSSRALNPRER